MAGNYKGEDRRHGTWNMRALLLHSMLVVVSLVLALCFGEGMLRVMWPQDLGTWFYTRDGLTIHFSNMTQASPRFGHDIVTNSAGMRDREHTVQKKDGVFRILVLGDSFMEAYQVKFEDSFVSLIERQLQEKVRHEVEVINGSVSGWGTDDELTYLMREGVKYKPDLVLVAMTIHNDVSDNLREEYHTFRDGKLEQRPRSLVPWPSYAVVWLKVWLNGHSHLYHLVYQAAKTRWVSEQGRALNSQVGELLRKVPSDRIQTGWNMTQRLFEKLVSTAQSVNAKVAVVILPLYVQVYTEELDKFLFQNGLRQEDIDIVNPQETMARFGQELKFPVIDLLPIFRSAKAQYACKLFVWNDGHWNEKGHRIAAEFVAEQLTDSLVVSLQGR